MAVLDAVPGVKITVVVQGRPMAEYDDPYAGEDVTPPSNIVVKHIESQQNAQFSIRLQIDDHRYNWKHPRHTLEAQLRIDGHSLGGKLYRRSGQRLDLDSKLQPNVRDETGQLRVPVYTFKAVDILEGQAAAIVKKDVAKAEGLGTIEITLLRVIDEGASVRANESTNPLLHLNLKIAEKALKGKDLSHGSVISYGSVVSDHSRKVTPVPEDQGRPIGVFRFHYNSKDALRRTMILPRTPTPPASLSGLTQPEIERLALERLALDRQESSQEGKSVKREPAVKRERGADSEVIDLTSSAPKRSKTYVDLTDD